MKKHNAIWLVGLLLTLAVIIVPIVFFWPREARAVDDPWEHVPEHTGAEHTDHTPLLPGPYESPQEVTHACLECHPDSAAEVMQTTHWTWESEPVQVPWRETPVTVGKKTQGNNFCIGIQGNWPKCTTCHVGYGWEDANFDFSNPDNVDCLACHADMNLYAKGYAGNPVDGVDLAAAAQSVHMPTRDNCGKCHFNGGGGNGVKHGDLDESLYFPSANLDVHMGRYDLQCTDCHKTEHHQIKGHALSFAVEPGDQVQCTDCHAKKPHADERINDHVDTVACQTCHIPATALKDPTKTNWDWSTAGRDDIPEDHFTYLKIKGSFIYQKNYRPEYYWWNGQTVAYRYLWGDEIDPSKPVLFNPPAGSIQDPQSKIWPFKIHRSNVPYDTVNNILLQPKTVGEGGFWVEFDWQKALTLGSEIVGLPYSGQYDFTESWFFYPQTHMVQPKENALQCTECHGENGRLDWQALGYPGDPMEWGGRMENR